MFSPKIYFYEMFLINLFDFFFFQNTADSFKYATELLDTWKAYDLHLPRKCATFYAGMALKQQQPNVATQILATVSRQNYVTVRNIKVLALAQMERYANVLAVLRNAFEITDSNLAYKHTYTADVVCPLFH